MPKISIIVLVVAIVVLAGVVVWQGVSQSKPSSALPATNQPQANQEQQPQDETAGWKVYRNEQYGYEIKYPQDWTYNELTTPTKGEIVSFNKDNVGEIQIYSMANSNGDKSLKDWWYNNEYKRLGEPGAFFGGIAQYAASGAGGSGFSVYWKDNNNNKYVYKATMNFPSSLNYIETFQELNFYYQMLSTFKFVK